MVFRSVLIVSLATASALWLPGMTAKKVAIEKAEVQKARSLLEIDDCLIEAVDPAAADECLITPAAKEELVEETSFAPFAPFLATALAAVIFAATMPPSPDQGV